MSSTGTSTVSCSDFFADASMMVTGRREPDALQGAPHHPLQALEGQHQVRAALGGHQRVNLVEDDGLDPAQGVAGVRGEQQVQRLRGGDEQVC
jgi:hypothetical protein